MKHPITRSAIDTAATVLMALASIFMIGFIGWTALVSGRSAPRTAERPAIENVQGKQVRTTISGAPVIGRSDARIVLVEYSDFECPFCRRFEGDTFPRIKAAFVDTGRIRYAFRHRPLSNVHKNAQAAAQAANCARNQGRFWEMRSALFGATSLEIQMLPAIAVSAGRRSCRDPDRARAANAGTRS